MLLALVSKCLKEPLPRIAGASRTIVRLQSYVSLSAAPLSVLSCPLLMGSEAAAAACEDSLTLKGHCESLPLFTNSNHEDVQENCNQMFCFSKSRSFENLQ